MACCGQKRMALSGNGYGTTVRTAGQAGPGAVSSPGQAGDLVLRYRGAGAFSTRSPATGRVYTCAATGAGVAVDPRDSALLERTGLFERS